MSNNKKRIRRAWHAQHEAVIELQLEFGFNHSTAERAVKLGFDSWVWAQGSVQFLDARQIEIAALLGQLDLVEKAVEGADSASPFFTLHGGFDAVRKFFSLAVTHTRCVGYKGGHSSWAYGPVSVHGTQQGLKCSCGASS